MVRDVFKLGILIHRKSDSWVSHWKSVHRFDHETLDFSEMGTIKQLGPCKQI